jgi:2-oxoglutarate dehydrogenase complex dehydrogenase (E1) component-like enzyme
MDKYSYVSNADVGYLDQLYQTYKKDPTSVDATWQKFFEGYEFSTQRFGENGNGAVAEDILMQQHLLLQNGFAQIEYRQCQRLLGSVARFALSSTLDN